MFSKNIYKNALLGVENCTNDPKIVKLKFKNLDLHEIDRNRIDKIRECINNCSKESLVMLKQLTHYQYNDNVCV